MTAAAGSTEWYDQAACLGTDPEDWFMESGSLSNNRLDRLRATCHRCPVQETCLAIELREGRARQYGFRGGYTAEERMRSIRTGRFPRATPVVESDLRSKVSP